MTVNDSPALPRRAAIEGTDLDKRVLDAMVKLLGETAERRLTIDDIAKASGVARSTVFRRFGSKDALLEHVYASTTLTGGRLPACQRVWP